MLMLIRNAFPEINKILYKCSLYVILISYSES
jgi:hypothetical protein